MIDKSKLQESNTVPTPEFKNKISIKPTSNNKWLLMFACKQFVWEFDTWEEMIAQLATFLINPEKFYNDNRLAMGNRRLKDVDLHVITKHIENQLNND